MDVSQEAPKSPICWLKPLSLEAFGTGLNTIMMISCGWRIPASKMQTPNQNFKTIHTFLRWLVKGGQHFGYTFSLCLGTVSHPVITSVAADEVKIFQFWTALPCAVAVDSVLCRLRSNLPALSTKMSSVGRRSACFHVDAAYTVHGHFPLVFFVYISK